MDGGTRGDAIGFHGSSERLRHQSGRRRWRLRPRKVAASGDGGSRRRGSWPRGSWPRERQPGLIASGRRRRGQLQRGIAWGQTAWRGATRGELSHKEVARREAAHREVLASYRRRWSRVMMAERHRRGEGRMGPNLFFSS